MDEPCSPVLRRSIVFTESGTLTPRFRGDGRNRALRGRILEVQCTLSHKQGNLLSYERGSPRLVASDLVPELAQGFLSRLQLHQ